MAVDKPPSSLGHEIRSQLTVIKGYAQLVVRMLRRPDVPREDVLARAERLESHVAALETAASRFVDERENTDARDTPAPQ